MSDERVCECRHGQRLHGGGVGACAALADHAHLTRSPYCPCGRFVMAAAHEVERRGANRLPGFEEMP